MQILSASLFFLENRYLLYGGRTDVYKRQIITDECYRFNIYMLFFHNRNLKYAFSLELIPKKQALITKCFACQKITPYLIVKNKILHYTEKKGDLFASIKMCIRDSVSCSPLPGVAQYPTVK